ncbi:MAG: DUF2393 domain-containing protein [Campylobacterales bacterium]|nr:DUF2393 domain-containing protein [Campylobacterales bacterium]
MKAEIIAFIDALILYDYLLFGATAALFILFLLLAILLRHRIGAALSMVLFAFLILILAPTLGYRYMHQWLFHKELALTHHRALEFTDALMIKGTLTNTSRFPFTSCHVHAGTYKLSGYPIIDSLFKLNPFRKKSIVLSGPIEQNATVGFTLFFEAFHYEKDYNITLGADCR